ncbi:MAG: PilW family protein [Pseudomonas sp.]|uniref:PilW family protein n=1 Tax=Pseudomonas sp. TaxID=306 RepID=UPI002736FC5F|nr:PilW family protein [Pseudomonas sp.]MDP3845551.1 PilW family protein [Pseudomonas sp.]
MNCSWTLGSGCNRLDAAGGAAMGKPVLMMRGFGLIELMVAMTLGLLLTVGILTLYLDMSRSSAELAKTNLQIENGRLAIQLLRDDLVHAGFWNGFIPEFDDLTLETVPVDYPATLPAPCAAYSTWTASFKGDLLGTGVQLYSGVPTGCESALPDAVVGSDVLLVRHAQTCVAGVGNCEADTSDKLYFQTSQCEGEARYVLADSGFTLHKRDCTTAAEKRKFVNSIYYLRDYAVSPGDGIPTLMQSSFDLVSGNLTQQPAVAMIEGVQAMRFELGVDNISDSGAAVNYSQAVLWADTTEPIVKDSPTNRGDGAADAFCTSGTCTLDDMLNSVQIKVHLLVRDLEPSQGYSSDKTYSLAGSTLGPYSDNFKRHVYATTVRLSNISGRRETP